MTSEYRKPLPIPLNPDTSRPFWDAARRHELLMPRCKTCARIFFYPREACPVCLGSEIEWVRLSGNGRLPSSTAIHQPVSAAFQPDVPYVYALVQLDEGPRVV